MAKIITCSSTTILEEKLRKQISQKPWKFKIQLVLKSETQGYGVLHMFTVLYPIIE